MLCIIQSNLTGTMAEYRNWITLCNPMDCSLPGSSVHGILQARVLQWVAISFSRGSSQLKVRTWVSHIPGRCFNLRATREAHNLESHYKADMYLFRVQFNATYIYSVSTIHMVHKLIFPNINTSFLLF